MHDLQEAVAQEVAGTADAVDHAGTAHQGGVGVAVDVDLDRGVHGNDAQTTDRLRMVGDGERTQRDLVEILVHVGQEAREAFLLRQGQGAGGGAVETAGVEQVEHGVLEHFGVHAQVVEGALGQAAHDGVGDGTDARLDRQQVLGQATHFDFVAEEIHQVSGDGIGGLVRVGEGATLVRVFGFDDGDNFAQVAGNIGGADAGVGLGDVEYFPVGGILVDHDVVDPFQGGHGGVDFQDDLVGHHQDFGNGAAGCAQDQATLFGDGADFDQGQVKPAGGGVLGVEAVAQVLGEHGEMLVAHADAAFVDAGGDVLAGLVRPAAVDHVEGCPAVFGLSSDRGADEQVESHLALEIVLLHVVRERDGDRLGITGRGKSGPAEIHAVLQVLEGLLNRNKLAQKGLAAYTVLQRAVLRHFLPPDECYVSRDRCRTERW